MKLKNIYSLMLSSCHFVYLVTFTKGKFQVEYNILAPMLPDLERGRIDMIQRYFKTFFHFLGIIFRELSSIVRLQVDLKFMLNKAYSCQIARNCLDVNFDTV